jgi:hypothetical protein
VKVRKVIRNVLLSLVGLVLVLLVALQILLRPSVLTGIVNSVAANLVEGEVSFREVRAHVIKSFPFLNIDAKELSITYPHERYARYDSVYTQVGRRRNLLRMGYGKEGIDTLVSVRELSLSLNYVALAKGAYHIHKAELVRPRIFAHYYDSTAANWDILPLGGDSEKDTQKPLPPVRIDRVSLLDRPMVVFTNPVDTLHGMFTMRRLALDGKVDLQKLNKTEARFSIDSMLVSGQLPKDTLSLRLDHLRVEAGKRHVLASAEASTRLMTGSFGRLRVPIGLDLDADFPKREDEALEVMLNDLKLRLSALELEGKGSVVKRESAWDMDVVAAVRDCPLGEVIREYRDNLEFLKKVDTDARVSLEASAKGTYGEGQTPAINARLQVPASTIDYEGLGRKGRLAVDALVRTDDLQNVDAVVDRLLVDIAGVHIDATGKARDILGEDPQVQLDGSAKARLDSLTKVFLADMGVSGTGSLDMKLSAKARLSQLNAAQIGKADINCDLKGHNVSLEYPKDSASALLPVLDLNLATKGNTIDRNLKEGARVLALGAKIDTLDVKYGSTFVRGGKLHLLMQNSADVLKGRTDRSSIMGILRVNNLRMRDSDGLAVGLRENTERFRLEPASDTRPVPRLNLGSSSGALRVRMGSDVYSLRQVNFDISALRHQVRQGLSERRAHLLDSLQRLYPDVPRDSLFRVARQRRVALESRDDFASADISISLSDAIRKYFREWDVDGKLDVGSGSIRMPAFPLKTGLSGVSGTFDNDTLDLKHFTLTAGASDVSAQARLTGIRRAVLGRGRSRLKLKADVSSNHLDANELLRAYAYYSSFDAKDTLEAVQLPDTVDKSKLLVIPSNLEVDFSLEANSILYDSLEVSWAAADVAMRDRTVQITNALAATNMGDMYFEGFYSTRSKEDIKAGFDLNLVDITAEKVITLFPSVDTILPMLTSFAGDLDCELAATADIDTCMNLILPSIDGVMRISGKDLTLKDSEEFSRLAGKLMFKDRNEAHIDNMSVTGIVQDNTLEVFPFVLDVDRYMLAASGRQHLERDFRYHISVIKSPLIVKFGVDAWGPDFDNIHYGLTKAKYRSANVPVFTKQLDTVQFSLIAAIHNIFELGVEKAMEENRNAATQVSALSAREEESLPLEGEVPDTGGLAGLVEEVSHTVDSRREALKQEVVRLQKEAANEQ